MAPERRQPLLAGRLPKRKPLSQAERSEPRQRSEGAQRTESLYSGESEGKVFVLVGDARRAAFAGFLFSCRRLFSTGSHIGTSGALQRRRFCKSLIS
jgi:hypothetical protein